MKATVRLYGTLRQYWPEYRPSDGISVEVPEGSAIADLLQLIGIPETGDISVIANGRVKKKDEPVEANDHLNIFQALHGG